MQYLHRAARSSEDIGGIGLAGELAGIDMLRHRDGLKAHSVVAGIGQAVIVVALDNGDRDALSIGERVAQLTNPNVGPEVAALRTLDCSDRHGSSPP
jgi:hypothetical protein